MNRRQFVGTTLLGVFAGEKAFSAPLRKKRKLAFSTLACPEWTWPQIVSRAKEYGYDGVEIRGVRSELNVPDSPYFKGEAWKEAGKIAGDAGIEIINLNSSAHLHETAPAKIIQQMDMIKRDMELAEKLGCPFVRVFPDRFPPGRSKSQALDLFAVRLNELQIFGQKMKVKILLDAHGDLVWSEDLERVLASQKGKTGVIWDYFNMYSQTQEDLDSMFKHLRPYISLVQFKDGSIGSKGEPHYTLLGEGFLPKQEILDKLDKADYSGFISFEWEKRWHPDLAAPEIALPDFIRKMS